MVCWSLIPPVYFWYDWQRFGSRLKAANEDGVNEAGYVTHQHELGRNFWLALLAVLAYAFHIKFPS